MESSRKRAVRQISFVSSGQLSRLGFWGRREAQTGFSRQKGGRKAIYKSPVWPRSPCHVASGTTLRFHISNPRSRRRQCFSRGLELTSVEERFGSGWDHRGSCARVRIDGQPTPSTRLPEQPDSRSASTRVFVNAGSCTAFILTGRSPDEVWGSRMTSWSGNARSGALTDTIHNCDHPLNSGLVAPLNGIGRLLHL